MSNNGKIIMLILWCILLNVVLWVGTEKHLLFIIGMLLASSQATRGK